MKKPKVLSFDVEITVHKELLDVLHSFGLDERRVMNTMNAMVSHVTVFSYQWVGEKKVHTISQLDYPKSLKKDPSSDKLILKDIMKVFDEADMCLAHYGTYFDIPFLNTRIEKHKLGRLKPIRLRDTWRIARNNFKLPNNRLDTLIKAFDCPYKKPPLDWEQWRKAAYGDKKAFKLKIDRCESDAKSMTWLYENVLRKYDNQGLNHNLYTDKKVCAHCGSKNVVNDRYLPGSKTSMVLLFRCKACRGYSRMPVSGKGRLR